MASLGASAPSHSSNSESPMLLTRVASRERARHGRRAHEHGGERVADEPRDRNHLEHLEEAQEAGHGASDGPFHSSVHSMWRAKGTQSGSDASDDQSEPVEICDTPVDYTTGSGGPPVGSKSDQRSDRKRRVAEQGGKKSSARSDRERQDICVT